MGNSFGGCRLEYSIKILFFCIPVWGNFWRHALVISAELQLASSLYKAPFWSETWSSWNSSLCPFRTFSPLKTVFVVRRECWFTVYIPVNYRIVPICRETRSYSAVNVVISAEKVDQRESRAEFDLVNSFLHFFLNRRRKWNISRYLRRRNCLKS